MDSRKLRIPGIKNFFALCREFTLEIGGRIRLLPEAENVEPLPWIFTGLSVKQGLRIRIYIG